MYGLRVGADMYESNKLTGAIDELYVYTSALDREAISVLWVDATGAYSGDTYKNGHARNLGPTESRDGGDAFGFDGTIHVALPRALFYGSIDAKEARTLCLWARIDDWDNGQLFEYGGSTLGTAFGLAAGDTEGNVSVTFGGSAAAVVVIEGNASYIDWDDWHHYCLTFDGDDVVVYFDGFAEATGTVNLNTGISSYFYVGANVEAANKLTGAIDELYVYTSALDQEAISVLYGSVTASRR
ncbi:hypothetical protein JL721_772 [Aureococcus anophagefferens]|nr:hypothetical protein JL721_772 [Aureococcus anophagefferens]